MASRCRPSRSEMPAALPNRTLLAACVGRNKETNEAGIIFSHCPIIFFSNGRIMTHPVISFVPDLFERECTVYFRHLDDLRSNDAGVVEALGGSSVPYSIFLLLHYVKTIISEQSTYES